jgi:Tfp pilus assembly protein PilW
MSIGMKNSQKGFTIVELIITMLIFMIVIVAAANIFVALLGNFKQQSKIAESNIEGIIGLQILRRDIEQAGYGLPWSLPPKKPDNTDTYTEAGAITTPYAMPWVGRNYNDGPPINTATHPVRTGDTAGASNPPGAIRSADNLQTEMNNSDVLVLKAVNIGISDTVQKWTYALNTTGSTHIFGPVPAIAAEAFQNNERVIVVRPVQGINTNLRVLMTDSTGKFYANFRASGTPSVYDMAAFKADTSVAINAEFLPPNDGLLTYMMYGIHPLTSPVTNPSRPFNRADYYVRRPATNMPSQCAAGTGILYKAVLSQTDNTVMTELPLLDCVADMQFVFGLDTDGNATIDSYSQDITTLSAAEIRNQLREVRVYIIAHEGQRDTAYTYSNPNPVTGCTGANQVCINDVGGVGFIKAFTVPSLNYRWKLYTMIVNPYNLR